MGYHKPKELKVTEQEWKKLREVIRDGIKQKLSAAKYVTYHSKEVAAGIYVYAIEELGKLLMLENAPVEDKYHVIAYYKGFLNHENKFRIAFEYLKNKGLSECITIYSGSFASTSFDPKSFTTDTYAETEARLGVFYTELEYSSDSDIAKGIRNIPPVDNKALNTAINCLENVMNQWT